MIASSVIDILVVVCSVIVFAELLFLLNQFLNKIEDTPRISIVIAVLGVILINVISVVIFAWVYYFLINKFQYGALTGAFSGSVSDCIYFSFVNYTSLGMGDIIPVGNVRFLVGLQTLVGLIFITWSASFLYIQMQNIWRNSSIFFKSKTKNIN